MVGGGKVSKCPRGVNRKPGGARGGAAGSLSHPRGWEDGGLKFGWTAAARPSKDVTT